MGNTASKKGSVIVKTPEKSVAAINDQSPQSPLVDDIIKANQMHDPKTPAAIPQTPLTQTIAHHLITKDDTNKYQAIQTPSYLLRKKILYDLGYNYTIKDTDPRSPSLSIPRTPLNLTENSQRPVDESDSSSFQYNTTLEDSCRDFNAKLDDITMDEETEMVEEVQNDESGEDKVECIESPSQDLCEQKTPNCELNISPDFENRTNANDKTNIVGDGSKIKSKCAKSSEENINPHDGMCSTPLMGKFNRSGRIPLSVINRHCASAELTPLQSKNNHESYSVESYKPDLSFNKLNESRGSARKSKIPVYKK